MNAESYANWKNVYREFLKSGESKETYCLANGLAPKWFERQWPKAEDYEKRFPQEKQEQPDNLKDLLSVDSGSPGKTLFPSVLDKEPQALLQEPSGSISRRGRLHCFDPPKQICTYCQCTWSIIRMMYSSERQTEHS